ncbi:MAG: aspartate--ammonia ligase [Bacilli bacterium]
MKKKERLFMKITRVNNYQSKLGLLETQIAIKELKDFFQINLAKKLNLKRVSAPLFVEVNTGLNDNLSGYEHAVSFDAEEIKNIEIVHSLAKWKRYALKRYDFSLNEGLYTDMNAIRKHEDLSNIHSLYVDQWDWEKIISKENRSAFYLKEIVNDIYSVLKQTEQFINEKYPFLNNKLPEEITFIDSQTLLDLYPDLNDKEREEAIIKRHKAVFLTNIGHDLSNGIPHDNRAPDYDDWNLNGDILVYNEVLDSVLELSSMGIRVCEDSLLQQLTISNTTNRTKFNYHQCILNKELPYTVGGGIGQSRLCLFFLEKAHIGEVQCSCWPPEMVAICQEDNIKLL